MPPSGVFFSDKRHF